MQSCGFIGHKNCPNEIKNNLIHYLKELIINKNVNTFYVGTHGNFDKLVYDTLCELEKQHNFQLIVVLAYINRKRDYEYYDFKKTIFPDELTKVPLRFAINKRNSYIVNHSEYIISYLNTPFSNTYNIVGKALKKGKQVINLGDFDINSIF